MIKNLQGKLFTKTLAIGILSIVSTTIIASGIFFITKGHNPYTDELAYSEKSNVSSVAGAVVPASCDSNPPVNHFAGDCPNPTVAVSGLPATVPFGIPKSNISWTTTGARGCTVLVNGAPLSNTGVSGTLPGFIYPSNTTFEFICSNVVGVTTSSGVLTLTINPKVQLSVGSGNAPSATAIASPMGPTTLTTDMNYVIAYDAPTLSWNAPGATSCTASSSFVIWKGSVATPSGAKFLSTYAGSKNTTRRYDLACTNGVSTTSDSVSITYEGSYMNACFTAGTKVLMADKSYKNIEDVTVKDTLITSGGKEDVMKLYHIPYRGLVYAFNGDGNYFVTPSHPFMTTEGWKSIDPRKTLKENHGKMSVGKLSIGDTLILRDGGTKKLTQLDSKEVETVVYNFGVNGTHDFYANDYLVHNVDLGKILEKVEAAAQYKP